MDNEDTQATAKGVTRDVTPDAVRDLLEQPCRGSVAFVGDHAIDVLPARTLVREGVHHFAVRRESAPDLAGREVVLMRDGGAYWFELRGISVRGRAHPSEPPPGGDEARFAWYRVDPTRVLAWDYGSLREASA
jgi:hypothetical protein